MNHRSLSPRLLFAGLALLAVVTAALAQTAPTSYTFVTLAGVAPGSQDGTGPAARFWNRPAWRWTAPAMSMWPTRKTTRSGKSRRAGVGGRRWRAVPDNKAASMARAPPPRFSGPSSVAVDSVGNIYLADSFTIRKVTPAGAVSTLAGIAGQSGSIDGTGSAARFDDPHGVAVDGAGNVFIADSATIRKRRRRAS